MGSFLSFMMPKVEGLMFQFGDDNLNQQTVNGELIKQGILKLDDEWFEKKRELKLKIAPLRITAIASK
jgi:hypothetical protein